MVYPLLAEMLGSAVISPITEAEKKTPDTLARIKLIQRKKSNPGQVVSVLQNIKTLIQSFRQRRGIQHPQSHHLPM